MARRKKLPKTYPSARSTGIVRFTPCTPSELRRRDHSITLRIGKDLVEWIRQAAKDHALTQGELARALLVEAINRLESGDLELPESAWYAGQEAQIPASDPLGRQVSVRPAGNNDHD